MRREGRQHGMVRSYRTMPSPLNQVPESRLIAPSFGVFAKVSTKPTNHSKFTGKCGRAKCSDCHIHPACKSKDKTKGTYKLKSLADVSSEYNRLSWRVVDAKPTMFKKLSGSSASGILDHLDDHRGDSRNLAKEGHY